MAITIGGSSNIVGTAIGFYFPTIFVNPDSGDRDTAQSQVGYSLLAQAIISVVLVVLMVFTFQNKPKLPPCPIVEVPAEENIFKSYYKLITNIEFLKLTLCFTMFYNNIGKQPFSVN
jgi:hypothetical protein